MYNTVIFDLDGVIIDSEFYYCKRLYDFLKKKNHPIKERDSFKIAGMSFARTRQLMKEWFGDDIGNGLADEYIDFIIDHPLDYKNIVCVGVLELISELKDKEIKLAIASSGRKQSVINVLKELDIFKKFDFIMTGDDVIKSKPDPEIYLRTAKGLQTDIKKCIVIEDSCAGISSGIDAGAFVIAKEENRFGYSQDKADVICKDFAEIRNYMFENLFSGR